MASYDNEIYRGPPEAGPTLEHDLRSYGSDVYIVKAEKNTLTQDVPPTEEPIRQETKPVQKKESKIAKAMKLLASCTAAVTLATTLATAPQAMQEVDAIWPYFGPRRDGIGGFTFNPVSQNSGVCQVSIGGKSFRLEAQQEGIHLQWHETYQPSDDGSTGGFYVCMENIPENWTMILDFSVNPLQKEESTEGLCQLTAATGETLYVRGFFLGSGEQEAQSIMDQLAKYIRITNPTTDGWDKVQIGETMYSDTNQSWNGIQTVNYHDGYEQFGFMICTTDVANYDLDNLVCQHRVNGIDWSFYISIEQGDFMLWAAPAHENIAFGRFVGYMLSEFGLDAAHLQEMYGTNIPNELSAELAMAMKPRLLDYIERVLISGGLQYYHRMDQPTQNTPAKDIQQTPIAAGWNTSRVYPNFFSIQPGYENHGSCLFSAGDTVYLATPKSNDYYLFWQETLHSTQPAEYGYDEPYEYRSTTIILYNARDQWQAELIFLLQPPDEGSGLPTLATLKATDGQLFYLVSIDCTDEDLTRERAREIDAIADHLSDYLSIQVMESGSWGHLLLGDHLISDITPAWTGLSTVKHADYSGYRGVNMNWSIDAIRYTNSIDFQKLQSLRSQEVNGIAWTFYAPANSPDFGYDEDYLWAVPSHGDMSLGINIQSILRSMFGESDELWNSLQENPYMVMDVLPDIIDMVIEDGLVHIYPFGKNTPPKPDHTEAEDFYHRVDFTLNSRSFQMDSARDDVSFRWVRKDGDSAVIDLRIADDDIVVRMQWATAPTDKDQYAYTLANGSDLYYALHNLEGYRQLSESELYQLAESIYFDGSYLYITEHSTDIPETAPSVPQFSSEPYYRSLEFSAEGRTFRIDAQRDDVCFRQVWQGIDHTQFDFRADADNIRVQLIVSTNPNGEEYQFFPLGNSGLFIAAFNYWGEPWIYDSQTLSDLTANIFSYVQLTETSEPVLPEPYPEMDEFLQYNINYDVRLDHTEFAKSGRVCQFVTDRGNYRLRAQVPEIFVTWEDYYYDVKEEMGNSLISIRHYEEGWSLEAWVFTEPVDSIYQGFPMMASDGSQLWFYVSKYPETYDDAQLQSLMDRIPELLTLSAANDDDWGKVRIGETLISHNNQYWNGLAYTSGSIDFWYFEKILDSHALSGYDLRHAGQRVVNGITWDFYTLGSPAGFPTDDGKDYYFTDVYVVCGQEDLWLQTSLSYGLSPSESLYASQAEYEANLDKEMAVAINTIVRDGLSNYYPYP